MTRVQVIVIVACFVLLDAAIVGAVLYGCALSLREFAGKFPFVPAMSNAVRRDFQSFRIGHVGLGWSLHVAVDERHLHLYPSAFLRALRVPAMSVPWEAIQVVGKFRIGRGVRARIAGQEVHGPEWCLGLASPGTFSTEQTP